MISYQLSIKIHDSFPVFSDVYQGSRILIPSILILTVTVQTTTPKSDTDGQGVKSIRGYAKQFARCKADHCNNREKPNRSIAVGKINVREPEMITNVDSRVSC